MPAETTCAKMDVAALAGQGSVKRFDFDTPEAMAEAALRVKDSAGAPFCRLPFGQTTEAAALGADLVYSDTVFGYKARSLVCQTGVDLLALPAMRLADGPAAMVAEACRILKSGGHTTLVEVNGPFTIFNYCADLVQVVKLWRKSPGDFARVLAHLQAQLSAWVALLRGAGVDIVSYADSVGGVDILGPRLAGYTARAFTLPFLQAAQLMAPNTLLHLCPKTSAVLLQEALVAETPHSLAEPLPYGQALLAARGHVALTGGRCINSRAPVAAIPAYTLCQEVLP